MESLILAIMVIFQLIVIRQVVDMYNQIVKMSKLEKEKLKQQHYRGVPRKKRED